MSVINAVLPTDSPEIGQQINAGGIRTNVHDVGEGFPVLMIHGSGPGVTAWANWRLIIPELSQSRRVIAPDMLGFGYTERPKDNTYNLDRWVDHLLALLDKLNIQQADIVGNSYGGALALAMAIRHPERVRRLVLMGSVGVSFSLTQGLDTAWGYEPSLESMRELLDIFAYDRSLVTDELAQLRYEASIRPGFQESFSAMFPAPRQQWIEALAAPEAAIKSIAHETLIIHGRDDEVIPLNNSIQLNQWIKKSQLHVFGECGHWTQIEHAGRFTKLVSDFLQEAE